MLYPRTSKSTDSCRLFATPNAESSPEFIGRIPRIVPLHPLSEDDLVRIIQEPEDSLLSQASWALFLVSNSSTNAYLA